MTPISASGIYETGSSLHLPSAREQRQRLVPQFRALREAFALGRIEVRGGAGQADPEKVVVIETVGRIDNFVNAVKRIPEMEWLAEWDEADLAPDEYFYDKNKRERRLGGRLFLIMFNQTALKQLLSLWGRYRLDPDTKFPHGLGRWRSVFQQLRTLRLWNAEDRLRETGLLDVWQEQLTIGQETLKFEAELWFRHTPELREKVDRNIRGLVERAGGRVIISSAIPDIQYHGVAGEIPRAAAEDIIRHPDTELIQCEQVMFFRPTGQFAVLLPDQDNEEVAEPPVEPSVETPSNADPIVALLDGLPLQNHAVLQNRLVIDDPDNWEADYPAANHGHGLPNPAWEPRQ